MTANNQNLIHSNTKPEDLSQRWHRQIHHDLKWIVDSPPLFEGQDGLNALHDRLGEVPKTIPPELETLLPPTQKRVGLYFESLLDLWLEHGLKLEIETRHQQIFEGNRTVGEIDFIVRDHDETRWHLESTVKFYLHYPSSESVLGSAFIGPDPRDWFERKYEHLMHHQLHLSIPDSEPAHRSLPITRGILFYHVSDAHNSNRPAGANPNHLRGIWMRASEWNEDSVSFLDIDRTVHLPKPCWLSGQLNLDSNDVSMTYQEAGKAIQRHFQTPNAPLMLSLRGKENGSETEIKRCIIVDDTWPKVHAAL